MKSKVLLLFYSLLLICALTVVSACRDRTPITIGFVAGLSGRNSDVGLAGLHGATLAVEEFNAAGGWGGRKVRLDYRDDQDDPKSVETAMQGLIASGVKVVIGPMTSQMTKLALPLANSSGVVLLSPTASSTSFSALDDSLFRIYPSSLKMASNLAIYARQALGLKRVQIIYDLTNRAYTEFWYRQFRHNFEANGGSLPPPVTFSSGSGTSFFDLAQSLTEHQFDALLVLANASDTALLCQQFRKLGQEKPVLSTEWAGTEELLQFGGAAVENLVFYTSLDRDNISQDYLDFRRSYRARFGQEAGFAAVLGFDATRIVLEALKSGGSEDHLKQRLLSLRRFQGLQEPVIFDEFGDVERSTYLVQVSSGRFRTLPKF